MVPPPARLAFLQVALAALLGGEVACHAASGTATVRQEPKSWAAATEEAREISALSDKINRMKSKLARWQVRYARAQRYYKLRKKLLKQQISIRKRQVEHHSYDEATYRAKKEQYFENVMCSLMFAAFSFDKEDQTKRLRILHLCMGRQSLALLARGERHRRTGGSAPPRGGSPALDEALDRALAKEASAGAALLDVRARLGLSLGFGRQGATSAAAQEVLGPTDGLRQTLRQYEQRYDKLQAQLASDKASWAAEIAELSDREDALGDTVYDAHIDKIAIRREAWETVKGNLCPVIHENYGLVDDEVVMERVAEKCLP